MQSVIVNVLIIFCSFTIRRMLIQRYIICSKAALPLKLPIFCNKNTIFNIINRLKVKEKILHIFIKMLECTYVTYNSTSV